MLGIGPCFNLIDTGCFNITVDAPGDQVWSKNQWTWTPGPLQRIASVQIIKIAFRHQTCQRSTRGTKLHCMVAPLVFIFRTTYCMSYISYVITICWDNAFEWRQKLVGFHFWGGGGHRSEKITFHWLQGIFEALTGLRTPRATTDLEEKIHVGLSCFNNSHDLKDCSRNYKVNNLTLWARSFLAVTELLNCSYFTVIYKLKLFCYIWPPTGFYLIRCAPKFVTSWFLGQ
jgi:hypothetical protein